MAKDTKKQTEAKAPAKTQKKEKVSTPKPSKSSTSKTSKASTSKTSKANSPKTTAKTTASSKTKKISKSVQAKDAKAKTHVKYTKVNVYNIKGESSKQIKLPDAFTAEFRPDIIKRAVKASRANRRQPYGPNPRSGMSHASSTWGKGRGSARVQRMTQVGSGFAVESPNNVGGRRAHPPKVEKIWAQKVNRKELLKARMSALAATADPNVVIARGHKFEEKTTIPVIVDSEIEKLKTTLAAMKTLENLGVSQDIIRAKDGRHIRAGRGKMRGRRYRKPRSILLVVSKSENAMKSFSNLPGMEITTPARINVEMLAPGGVAGRLTVISTNALKEMEKW